MSYDLQLWSVHPATRAALKNDAQWDNAPSGWAYSTRDWQIVVSHSDHVLPEDIPGEVLSLVPGIEYLTEVNLEGRISEASRRFALEVVAILARGCHGVVVDPQEGTQWTPSG
jgi:hypothetical protein